MHQDFQDLLTVFAEEQVEYLVIGGYAVSYYARPRYTKDIDLWLRDDRANLERAVMALQRFGVPEPVLAGLQTESAEDIVWFGVAPTRVDLLRRVDGLSFDSAYARRVETDWGDVRVCVVALPDLIAAKRAAGRPQDLRDLKALERIK
ncbi:MAG TPA: nucleotidyltransferase [Polyangiaceae bacterium]|nr:nucleotidyltransferase [Polyangiaceae bacterium]